MNKRGTKLVEFLMTYGWAILVVICALGALAYFGVPNHSKENKLPNVVIYDCGNIFVSGIEQTTGELQNASFAIKSGPNTPLNETKFTGRFLKAYYDMDACTPVLNTGNGSISLLP